jgi:multicomponent Na+:H+ antiporter subunit B
MTYSVELILVALVLATAFAAIFVTDLISSILLLGSYSFFLALAWAWLGAVDLAFVEAVIGAGLGTTLLLMALSQVRQKDILIRRTPPPRTVFLALAAVALLLVYAAQDLPAFGDPATPANLHIAPAYLENSVADSRTPNVVTSILMDYRGFDTLIETCVIFAAGIASAAIVGKR